MEVISSIYNSGYNIKKFYLGSRELNLAYLGNQVIYDEVIGDNDLNYILYEFYGSDTLPNTVEAPVKSAILKGNTKYRDIDTGDILDTFDETKNLELVSVKMPVLTTTGKNLIGRYEKVVYRSGREQEGATLDNDGNFTYVGAPGNRPCLIYKNNPNTIVTVSANVSLYGLNIYEYSDIPNFTREDEPRMLTEYLYTGTQKSITRTTSKEAKYIGISFYNDSTNIGYTNLQLEYGLQATVHEPFKSNILTVNEDVTLRGVGDVKDELNLLTGEVTYMLSEKRLTSDLAWVMHPSWQTDELMTFGISNINWGVGLVCNRFIKGDNGSVMGVTDKAKRSFYAHATGWFICLYKNELSEVSVQGFKEWLDNNETNIVYKLPQQSVKTVDLTIVDQDGKTINKLNSFNGTTYVSTEVAENSAYPMVSLEVASELQAAMSKVAEDIELIKPVQNDIETTLDTQSNDIDSLLLATTELFEMFL